MQNGAFIGLLIILGIILLFFTKRDSYCTLADTQIESNTFRFYPRRRNLNSPCNLNVSTDRDG